MNPSNKIVNPIPTKQSKSTKNPYDRIQSAPPDGKEEEMNQNMLFKEAIKQTNLAKKMNVNSHVFSGENNSKTHPVPIPDPSKIKKSTMPLSLHSSEFKNHPEKEKINTNLNLPPETTVTKPQEKLNETSLFNKKKLSLNKSSKPFMLGNLPGQEPVANNNALMSVANENSQPKAENPMFFQPKINFLEVNSSSFPKLTNKKSLKNLLPTTNSSNELHTQQNESQNNKELDETKEKNNIIFLNNKENETENKSLPPILEETHKIKEERKKNDSFNVVPPFHPQNNKNDEIKVQKLIEFDKEISKIVEPAKKNEILSQNDINQKIEETPKAVEITAPKVEISTPIVEKTIPQPEPIIPQTETTISKLETTIPQIEKAEIILKKTYKEFMISIIQIGKQTRLNNPPSHLFQLIQREFITESTMKRNTYKNQNQNQNRNKNDNYHNNNNNNNNMNNNNNNNNDKDDVMIERSQNPTKSNNTSHANNNMSDSHETLFFREPENKKKLEIKSQLHKWTKHFKEMGKIDNIKMQNTIRLNLNILTPDNFSKLKQTFVDLVKNNEDNLKILVDKIIEKAWNDPKYITTYASLCSFLQDEKSLQQPVEKIGDDPKKGKTKNLFKRLLLGRIQMAFEKQEFLKTKETDEIEENVAKRGKDTQVKKKKKIFGNVKFIGELYLCKVIPLKVINICVTYMVARFLEDYAKCVSEKTETVNLEYEDDLEAILILFDQVGKFYEKERTDKKDKKDAIETHNEKQLIERLKKVILEADKRPLSEEEKTFIKCDSNELSINAVFDLLKFLKDDIPNLSNRMQLLIENLMDRRNDGWRDKLFSNEGPKKIAELHEEIKKEQEESYKSAMEFKDKHPYDNYGKTRVYAKKEVARVQVAMEKTSKEEEKKEFVEAPQNPNNKVKLSFCVNRDVASKMPEREHKHTQEEVLIKVKDIFAKLNLENNENNSFDSFVKLSQKSLPSFVLASFFEIYANDKIHEVQKRLDIPYKLVKEKIIPKEDFLKEFNEYLMKSWEIASDVPFLVISLAKIFLLFKKSSICKFVDIEIVKNEDFEDIMYFLQDFVEATYKLLKEENLIEDYENDLANFVEKTSLNENKWYEKMKARC